MRLLPTPDTGESLNGHGRRGGKPANGHQSGASLDAIAHLLPTPTTQDGANNGGPSQFERNSLPLNAEVLLLPTPACNDMGAAYTPETWDAWTAEMKAKHGNGNGHGKSLNVEAQRLLPTPTTTQRGTDSNLDDREGARANLHNEVVNSAQDWGQYEPAIRRWESLTRPAPAPTEPGKSAGRVNGQDVGPRGNPRLSAAFSEWLMGLPDGWVTDVPGVTRNEALKALGNGVVPQQCAAAVRYLLNVKEVAA